VTDTLESDFLDVWEVFCCAILFSKLQFSKQKVKLLKSKQKVFVLFAELIL